MPDPTDNTTANRIQIILDTTPLEIKHSNNTKIKSIKIIIMVTNNNSLLVKIFN